MKCELSEQSYSNQESIRGSKEVLSERREAKVRPGTGR